MLPSALRTLSVLTLLTAVSGSVILTHQGKATSSGDTQAAAFLGPSTIARDTLDQRASRSATRTAFSGDTEAAELTAFRAERRREAILRVTYDRLMQTKWAAEKAAARKQAQQRSEARAKAARDAARERTARAARASRSSGGASYSGDSRSIARAMLADRGWSGQFSCLDSLWQRESGWNYRAQNSSSGAYGIPQALPGSKMASAGSDWRSNPATQIRWGLDYIADRYGSPCGAWSHSQSSGWY